MPNMCYVDVTVYGCNKELLRLIDDMIGKEQVLFKNIENYQNRTNKELFEIAQKMMNEAEDIATYSKILPQPLEVLNGSVDAYFWRYENWGVSHDIGKNSLDFLLEAKNKLKSLKHEDSSSFFLSFKCGWRYPDNFFRAVVANYDVTLLVQANERGTRIHQEINYLKSVKNGHVSATKEVLVDTTDIIRFRYLAKGGCFAYALEEVLTLFDKLLDDSEFHSITLSAMLEKESTILESIAWLFDKVRGTIDFIVGFGTINDYLDSFVTHRALPLKDKNECMKLLRLSINDYVPKPNKS